MCDSGAEAAPFVECLIKHKADLPQWLVRRFGPPGWRLRLPQTGGTGPVGSTPNITITL